MSKTHVNPVVKKHNCECLINSCSTAEHSIQLHNQTLELIGKWKKAIQIQWPNVCAVHMCNSESEPSFRKLLQSRSNDDKDH